MRCYESHIEKGGDDVDWNEWRKEINHDFYFTWSSAGKNRKEEERPLRH